MYTNRISTTARYNMLVADIQRNEQNYNKLTTQLASGKKVSSITDDPIAAVNIVNTNRQLGRIDTFDGNVKMAMEELDTLDDLMEMAGGYLTQAWDKAVQANNGTYGVTSLKALKVEIDEITKTMVDLANTEFNGNSIFGGANTKIAPYEIDENGDIIYNGTKETNPDYIRKTEVANGVFEVINTTGDKIFGWYKAQAQDEDGNDLFTDVDGNTVIKKIITTYEYDDGTEYTGEVTEDEDDEGNPVYYDENGDELTRVDTTTYTYEDGTDYTDDIDELVSQEDYAGVMGALKLLSDSIQEVIDAKEAGDSTAEEEAYKKMFSTLDMFSDAHNDILTEQTKFGGVYNRLQMTESTLETNNQNLTSYLSSIQDVDLAEATSKWLQAQYAYQASLKVASSSMGMSLLNYI